MPQHVTHITALKVNVVGVGNGSSWLPPVLEVKETVEVCSVLFNKAEQKLIKRTLLSVWGSRV